MWRDSSRTTLLVFKQGEFWNTKATNAAQGMTKARELSAVGTDVYFACAVFKTAGSRTAENASGAYGFWADIDCGETKAAEGKGYGDVEQGLAALKAFCQNATLPEPTILVNSGGGIHAYWTLAEFVSKDDWQVHARQLKAVMSKLGFLADPSRTADIASLLRVPGTLNHKYQPAKPVQMRQGGDGHIANAAMFAAIEAAYTRVCGSVAATPASAQLSLSLSEPTSVTRDFGAPDMRRLRSALKTLPADCDEATWTLCRIAVLARLSVQFPQLATELEQLAKEWSSGKLAGVPSKAWVTPGLSTKLTGEELFPRVWERFRTEKQNGKVPTVGTIYHDAKKAGWHEGFEVVEQASVPTEHPLDLAQRLDRSTFPNAPFNGAPPATLANVKYLLETYGITARYDCIKKKLRINIPGHTGSSDNSDNTAITTIISLTTLNGIATGQIAALVDTIGDRNQYNPVADWINVKPWDGTDRLPALFDTIHEREGFSAQLKRTLMYKWLLSAVAAALKHKGFTARGVLTFQGPQGIGKTSWIAQLVNESILRDMLIKVDHHLDPHDKDSVLGAVTHWIVEIGELDSSFRKSDVSRLKGVLTRDSDKVRRPYAKAESEYQRRTVFAATVNEENFLVDHTGNTRWWTIPVIKIDYQHTIDMQQVFAQLKLDFDAGVQWWLTKEEEALLEQHNSEHRSVSLMRERLMGELDLSRKGHPENPNLGTIEVLERLGYERPTNGDTKELTALLRELLGDSKKVNGTQKWRIPFKQERAIAPWSSSRNVQ